jgi:hypothetical protein
MLDDKQRGVLRGIVAPALALDRIEADQARERRLLRNTLIVCAVIVAVGALVVWGLFYGGPGLQVGPAIRLPASSQR